MKAHLGCDLKQEPRGVTEKKEVDGELEGCRSSESLSPHEQGCRDSSHSGESGKQQGRLCDECAQWCGRSQQLDQV